VGELYSSDRQGGTWARTSDGRYVGRGGVGGIKLVMAGCQEAKGEEEKDD